MKILDIELINFRNLENERISFINKDGSVKKFVAIIGDNGVGKTAILESITKGFTPIVRTISDKSVKECDLNNNDIKNGKGWVAIKSNVKINEDTYSWYNKRRLNSKIEYDEKVNNLLDFKNIKKKYSELYEKNTLPLILYYGINRVVKEIPKRGHIKEFRITDALTNCFDNVNYFRDFYEWFKTEEDVELREKKEDSNYRNIQLDSVRLAVERMIPGYKNLRIKLNPSRMIISNAKGEDLRIEQLSGGYKAILSLICDISKRLALANPNTSNPLEEEAIILIDELDLHLHPKWQKNIAQDLKRTFPNCQFIVTTHSPFIIQSLRKDELINLEKSNYCENENESFRGWSIEEIQEYEMGVQTKTKEYKRYLEEFSSAIDYEDIKSAKLLYEKLVNMLYPSSYEKKIIDLDMVGLDD